MYLCRWSLVLGLGVAGLGAPPSLAFALDSSALVLKSLRQHLDTVEQLNLVAVRARKEAVLDSGLSESIRALLEEERAIVHFFNRERAHLDDLERGTVSLKRKDLFAATRTAAEHTSGLLMMLKANEKELERATASDKDATYLTRLRTRRIGILRDLWRETAHVLLACTKSDPSDRPPGLAGTLGRSAVLAGVGSSGMVILVTFHRMVTVASTVTHELAYIIVGSLIAGFVGHRVQELVGAMQSGTLAQQGLAAYVSRLEELGVPLYAFPDELMTSPCFRAIERVSRNRTAALSPQQLLLP